MGDCDEAFARQTTFTRAPEPFCRRALIDLWGDELAINARHALVAASLPNHHKDPFDRILIAQAIVEGATLVTADHTLSAYQVPLLWATAR
jgi:PIN domain nuclease of toxin-antitoxin system